MCGVSGIGVVPASIEILINLAIGPVDVVSVIQPASTPRASESRIRSRISSGSQSSSKMSGRLIDEFEICGFEPGTEDTPDSASSESKAGRVR